MLKTQIDMFVGVIKRQFMTCNKVVAMAVE